MTGTVSPPLAEFTPTKAAALRKQLGHTVTLWDVADTLLDAWVESESKERRDEIIAQWHATLEDASAMQISLTNQMVAESVSYVANNTHYAAFMSIIRGRTFIAYVGERLS